MKICVIGLGYIGMPTSVMFASHGCEVVGIDTSEYIIENLNRGQIVIEEPGLEALVKKCVQEGSLRASTLPETADAFIVAVPTPFKKDGTFGCDLTYVLAAVTSILPYLSRHNTVIIESTIAPRSMDDYVKPMFEDAGYVVGEDIYLAHCPERVLPGKILHELEYNNRIIGGITPKCTEMAAKVYETFVKGELIRTEAKTAELSKCMENTFRDVNIALANELAMLCNELDINCLDVIRMANKHPRVSLLQPGPGVGGHCLAIDPYFICEKAPNTSLLIKLARQINSDMPDYVVSQVKKIVGRECVKIAVLGTAYKGNIDDIRESPALKVAMKLKVDYEVAIHDPHVKLPDYVSLEEAVSQADLVLVLCDHNEFRNMDHKMIAGLMRKPLLFDTRNMIEEQEGSGLRILNYGNLYQYKEETDEI